MTVWKFLTSHNSSGGVHGDRAHIPHKSCNHPSTCASPRVSDSNISELTRKSSPTCVHLDAKNYNYDQSFMSFTLLTGHLTGCGDTASLRKKLLMKVPFEKDNPFISISTYFLSNSYTLATAYREKSSCSS